jgi:hypothetical protein
MAERCLHFLHCLQYPSQAKDAVSSSAVIRKFRIGSKVNFTRSQGKTMTRKQRGEVGKSVAWSLGAEEAEGKELTPDADLLVQVRFKSREAGDSGR